MGAALGRGTSAQPPVVPSKGPALPKFYIQDGLATADDEGSSSALINADAAPSEHTLQTEERLQIRTSDNAGVAASKLPSSMLCCFTSGSNFQSLGSPKFGSLLWQGSGSFKFLTRTLSGSLLPPMDTEMQGRLTVVLDLDGAQEHHLPDISSDPDLSGSFVPVPSADFVASVPVDGEPTNVWVYKRPYLDYFLQQVAAHFEVVVFTASLATYADVVLDIIDKDSIQRSGGIAGDGARAKSWANAGVQGPSNHVSHNAPQHGNSHRFQQESTVLQAATHDPFASGVLTCVPVVPSRTLDEAKGEAQQTPRSLFSRRNSNPASTKDSGECCTTLHHRLYRGSCVRVSGSYIKDLSRLGRNLARTVIVDNSPTSYMWNPENAIPSVSFIDDKSDTGLLKVLEILMYLKDSSDVRADLPGARAAAAYYVPLS